MSKLLLGNGTSIQIAAIDFDPQYDWATASLNCQAIGEGWRLPTIYEIEHLYENSALFNFANYGYWTYWTGEEINSQQAYGFSGDEGLLVEASKNDRFYVRAVRTIENEHWIKRIWNLLIKKMKFKTVG